MRSRILTSRFRERAIVTTKTGHVFTGILYSCDNTAMVLRDVEVVGAGENRTNLPVDGEMIVHLDNVDFWQRVS